MKKGEYLDSILRSRKSIFSTADIALLWQEQSSAATRVRLHYYVKQNKLIRVRKGLYAKSVDYDKLELATRIFTPSYVSFETVLATKGIIFQYSTQITVASYLSRDATVRDQIYRYKKIKDVVLMNHLGVFQDGVTAIASKERAVLDTLYNANNYHFDNTRSLDWEKIFELLPMYRNKSLTKRVQKLFQDEST